MDDPRESALHKVASTADDLAETQEILGEQREALAEACQEAHEAGIPDRELADLTTYSRARIQQFRCGDPRKVKVAA